MSMPATRRGAGRRPLSWPAAGATALDARIEWDGGDVRIELRGELEGKAVAELETVLDAAAASDAECVLLDLRHVAIMDPDGLDAILTTHKRLSWDRALLLKRGPRQVQQLFRAAGVEQALFFLD